MDKDKPEQPVEPQDEITETETLDGTNEGEAAQGVEATEEDLSRLLEDARNKADDNWNQLIRAKAELDNLRKRTQRDLENAHKFATEKFSQDLLQVWDSLELGYQAAQDENADVGKLREGTELTLKLLGSVMQKNGIEQLDPMGEAFNPEFHQAMSMQERGDVEPNTIVAVVQKGYTLNGRLMRPAMVMVSKAPAASD